ncbi:MAG TPA: alpha/beta hydrolase [Solirubrobacteraceae bacterium]|nr:alpha/beta hydrolase [Solirubrobacteraceae bacterium]
MSPAAVRQDRVRVGGGQSPLIEAGPREASEAMVFVHGNPGSCTDWTALVGAAGEFGRALAVDMPGFGKAHRPAGFKCEVASYAEFLQGAMRELGVERAHLVLHDFGGPFGLLWGLQHGEAWASVVLVNIGVMPGFTWHKMAKIWRTPVLGELSQAWIPRSAWHRMMRKANPRGLPAAFVDKMYDDYDRETRRTVLELYRSTPEPGDVADAIGAEIAKLRIPALVVWGAKDPFIGVEFAERQREFFEVRDLVVLPESGHWPFQDDPERFAAAVLPFLRERISERDPRPTA